MDGYFIVVGDDYAAFAKNTGVLTVSQLIQRLRDPARWRGDERVVIGQGIDESIRALIHVTLQARHVHEVQDIDELALLELTHKRLRGHVLITAPRKVADREYRFSLALNDRSDRLSDHVTGQHVGAMLLLEAARQAMIVCLECEYVTDQNRNYGLILERYNSTYHHYAFPLPTSIDVTLRELRPHTPAERQIPTQLDIVFSQAGIRVCEMQLDVTLYEAALLAKVETMKARKLIETLCSAEERRLLASAGEPA